MVKRPLPRNRNFEPQFANQNGDLISTDAELLPLHRNVPGKRPHVFLAQIRVARLTTHRDDHYLGKHARGLLGAFAQSVRPTAKEL